MMERQLLNNQETGPQSLPQPSEWLDRYGDALYGFAVARLKRTQDAEEAVQETLLAALKSRDKFQGRSEPRTWLIGILKHQIARQLQKAARAAKPADPDELDVFFTNKGKWRQPPGRWHEPTAMAERSEFWRVLSACLTKLPARMAAVFTLRTLDEQPPDEVCRELEISTGNFWVLMHRARLRLVRCLQINWFAQGK
jgi:RNA polymerase sigma-70 factor (TIGR02943 family)